MSTFNEACHVTVASNDVRAMPRLSQSSIKQLQQTALRLRLERHALLSGIAPAFVASLESRQSTAAQLLTDLCTLNDVTTLSDNSDPLVIWLLNAETLSADRREAAIFRKYLRTARDTAERLAQPVETTLGDRENLTEERPNDDSEGAAHQDEQRGASHSLLEGLAFGTFGLLFRPLRALQHDADGSLRCAGVSATTYFLIAVLAQAVLVAIADGNRHRYLHPGFLVVFLAYALVRIVLVGILCCIVGATMRLKLRAVVSAFLFSSALFSFLGCLPLLPVIHRTGLPALLDPRTVIGATAPFPTLVLISRLLLGAGDAYNLLYMYRPLKVSTEKLLAFVVLLQLGYHVLRPWTVVPVFAYYSQLLEHPPW